MHIVKGLRERPNPLQNHSTFEAQRRRSDGLPRPADAEDGGDRRGGRDAQERSAISGRRGDGRRWQPWRARRRSEAPGVPLAGPRRGLLRGRGSRPGGRGARLGGRSPSTRSRSTWTRSPSSGARWRGVELPAQEASPTLLRPGAKRATARAQGAAAAAESPAGSRPSRRRSRSRRRRPSLPESGEERGGRKAPGAVAAQERSPRPPRGPRGGEIPCQRHAGQALRRRTKSRRLDQLDGAASVG
ncbi:uncharacterized protein [Penaeus vannamei]|uniref:uncharacterized protein n=1 Tax=Penaeus vannamei TaxID=6689 RepID=UPI00387FA280